MTADDLSREFVALQQSLGWNNAKVARRLRVQPGTISKIHHGRNPPSETLVEMLRVIAALEKMTEAGVKVAPVDPYASRELRDAPPWPPWAARLMESLEAMEYATRNNAVAACRNLIQVFERAKQPTEEDKRAAAELVSRLIPMVAERVGMASGFAPHATSDDPTESFPAQQAPAGYGNIAKQPRRKTA